MTSPKSRPAGYDPRQGFDTSSEAMERHKKAGLAFVAELEEKYGLKDDEEYHKLVEEARRQYEEWDEQDKDALS